MSANEFDNIGKRLYDEEADPPLGGWAKINAELTSSPKPGKIVSWRKYGWMLFIILVPISFYYANVQKGMNLLNGGGASLNDLVVERPVEDKFIGSIAPDVMQQEPMIEEPKNSSVAAIDKIGGANDVNQLVETKRIRASKALTFIESNTAESIVEPEVNLDEPTQAANPVTTESPMALDLESLENKYEPFDVTVEKNDIENRVDSLKFVIKQLDEIEKERTKWRISASIMPQYSSVNLAPVDNDDILITNINTSNKFSRDGYGVFVSVGRSVTRSLYVDLQLSFLRSQQQVAFSYATGKVDTLIAEPAPDESYQIKPVYETASRYLSTTSSYGGLRIGGTYYFLHSRAGRFYVNSSIGVDALLSERTTENIEGEWKTVSGGTMNKLNCSLMVGGGYSINLSRGWEASINPVFRYNINKTKNSSMPYSSNQQSIGLNIGLSKTISTKS